MLNRRRDDGDDDELVRLLPIDGGAGIDGKGHGELDGGLRRLLHHLFHHLLHRELSLEHLPQMKEAIVGILLRNLASLKAIVQKGINSGEFKPVDIELTIATLIGTINHLLLSGFMCRKILQKPKNFNPYQSKKLKERLSEHLKTLLRAHLLVKHVMIHRRAVQENQHR